MKHRLLLLIIISFLSSIACATDDYRSIALEAKNNAPHQVAAFKQDADNAILREKNLTHPYQEDARVAETKAKAILNQYAESQGKPSVIKKPISSVLIFVSFSMPTQSIEAYLRDAKKINASVVIRGLIDNSFQKTFQRMASLVKASGGEGVELNPIWFKRFGIQAVPAIVVIPEGSACFTKEICNKDSDFDVMAGDITLATSLRVIRDKETLTKDIAQSAILKLQSLSHA